MSKERWSRYLRVYDPLKAGSIDGTDTRPHDRGIERALESIYVPSKDIDSEPSKTLFVGRLSPDTTEETLQTAFSKFGEIKSLSLIRDIVTGFSKRYAFVEFELRTDAEEACERMNSRSIDNHGVFVDWEIGRTLPKWIPRRLGGGFGGRKESGQLRFGGKDRPFKKPFIIGREPPTDQAQRGDRRGGSERPGYRDRRYDRTERRGAEEGSDGEGYDGGTGAGAHKKNRESSRERYRDRRDGSRERVRVKPEPRDDEYGTDRRQRVRVKQERDRDRHRDRSRERARRRSRSRERSRRTSRDRSRERQGYHGDRERRKIKIEEISDGEGDRFDRGSRDSGKKRRFTEIKREKDS